MAGVLLHARDQTLRQYVGLPHRLGRAVLGTVDALTIAKLAPVQGGTAAGAVRQALGAGLGAGVQGVFKAATTAGVAAKQGPLHGPLQAVQHLGAQACCPQRLANRPPEQLTHRIATAEQQAMQAMHGVVAGFLRKRGHDT